MYKILIVSLSLISFCLFILFLWSSSSTKNKKRNFKNNEFAVKCSTCGHVWYSSSPEEIKKCPRCPPPDFCPETVIYILRLGTLNEIVRAQPDNSDAKEKQQTVEKLLKKHTDSCEKCRKGLEK